MSRHHLHVLAFAFVSGAAFSGHCASLGWKPAKAVEIVVSVGPGSAHDSTARMIQNIFRERKLVTQPIVVANKPGGGHTIAWNYVSQYGENGYSMLIAAVPILANKLAGKSTLTYSDFTPITQLLNEYVAFAVRKESVLHTGADLIASLRNNPRALSFAIGSAIGNGPHLALSLAMQQAGIKIKDLKTVIFAGGSEATLAVLGGHVDVLATLASNVLPFVTRGEMRVIAMSSPKRLGGAFAQVPTWQEQGINAAFSNFRVMLGTRGMDSAQVAYWEEAFDQLSHTDEWKQYLEKNNLDAGTNGSKETSNFLREEYARLQGVMTELGLAR